MDEVILRVSSKELSEFPCPFEGERSCDDNCDNSRKVTKNNQKKVTKVGISISNDKYGFYWWFVGSTGCTLTNLLLG